MHFSFGLALFPLISLVLPILSLPQATNIPTHVPTFNATSRKYYLKTTVIYGGPITKGDLYIEAYHTGAGTNDAVLVPKTPDAVLATGFLNGTYQEYDLGTSFQWGMIMGNDINYAGWEMVQINGGFGQPGFSFNTSGLQWSSSGTGAPAESEFQGWLACDWYHGLPQLFWLAVGYSDAIPCSCARVELHREFI